MEPKNSCLDLENLKKHYSELKNTHLRDIL